MAERFIISVIETYFDFTDILLNDTNYKDQISRYIQKNYKVFPSYKTSQKENNKYRCELYKEEELVSVGDGVSKKKAEQDASKKALIHYNVLTYK
jgi:ribonuclease III